MPTHSQTLKRCKRLEAYAGVVDEIVEPLGKEACNGPCKVVYCRPDAEVESKSDKAVAGYSCSRDSMEAHLAGSRAVPMTRFCGSFSYRWTNTHISVVSTRLALNCAHTNCWTTASPMPLFAPVTRYEGMVCLSASNGRAP